MAPKVSISTCFSKTQSNNISFKNKRRRKLCTENCGKTLSSLLVSSSGRVQNNAIKSKKSPKHRWKLNNEKPMSDDSSRMTIPCFQCSRQGFKCFQREFTNNNPPRDARGVDEKPLFHHKKQQKNKTVHNVHHFINAKSSQHENSTRKQTHFHDVSTGEKRKPQQRDFVNNCRKLLNWTTASGFRKLLPIFILVNMLPFLYAGESKL
jgi:hypothetical protein